MPCYLYTRGILGRKIMEKDYLVEEVREIRNSHARKFNYNLHEICLDLKKKEKECGHKIVSYPPKIILKATGT